MSTTPAPTPTPGATRVAVSTHGTYQEAQAAVDRLSDDGFPVERSAIVGSDLRYVEQVTGRLTSLRAALSGAASGALLGLFLGVLFGFLSFFEPVTSAIVLGLWGLVLGAVLGAVIGFVGHAVQGGRRDFSSAGGIQATRFMVQVDADLVEEARRVLATATTA